MTFRRRYLRQLAQDPGQFDWEGRVRCRPAWATPHSVPECDLAQTVPCNVEVCREPLQDIWTGWAYDVVSELHVKNVDDPTVAGLMADGSAAVQWIDPATPYIVGPAPFCKLWQLNDAHFVDQSNIIYTFDFFFPDVFFQAVAKYSCEECHTVTGQVCGSGVFFERRGESSGESWALGALVEEGVEQSPSHHMHSTCFQSAQICAPATDRNRPLSLAQVPEKKRTDTITR